MIKLYGFWTRSAAFNPLSLNFVIESGDIALKRFS